MELGLSQEAFGQIQEAKEKADEKVEKITEDLRRKCFHAILTCAALSACLAYGYLICRVSTPGLGTVPGAHGTSESP